MITPEILKEFKDRMKLGDEEDENLIWILSASNKSLMRICGDYDISQDEEFKELVFERARYVYNDALEYFQMNFLTQINDLRIAKALEEISLEEGDTDATV
jgi:hypothetical protein